MFLSLGRRLKVSSHGQNIMNSGDRSIPKNPKNPNSYEIKARHIPLKTNIYF
jgi:hypothetical protein